MTDDDAPPKIDADLVAGPAAGREAAISLAENPGGVAIAQLVAQLPPSIGAIGAERRWQAVAVAPTGVTVWRLDHPDSAPVFLKVAPAAGGAATELRAEGDRLSWLSELVATGAPLGPAITVPSVIASVTDPFTGDHYLATSMVPGSPASQTEARADAESLVEALAVGLRAVHELPTGAGHHVITIDDRLALAAQRIAEGLVDPREFEPIHARYRPEQLYDHLLAMRPPGLEDAVVVHGDPSLDNTLLAGGRVTGYVDLGRAGVSDRYLDLAIVARELATRVSPHALGPFFDAYGVGAPDVRKVDFYLLLDEFF